LAQRETAASSLLSKRKENREHHKSCRRIARHLRMGRDTIRGYLEVFAKAALLVAAADGLTLIRMRATWNL